MEKTFAQEMTYQIFCYVRNILCLYFKIILKDYENKKKMSTIMAYELLMPFVNAFINSKKLIIAQV